MLEDARQPAFGPDFHRLAETVLPFDRYRNGAFNLTLQTSEAKRRMAGFLAGGGQTRAMETGDLGGLAELLAPK